MTLVDENIIDEEKAVNSLRGRMKRELPPNLYDDDAFLKNFLKARNFNLNDTEEMLRKHLQFRKEIQLDDITKDYDAPEVLKKYFPQSFLGFTKSGSVIRYIPMGSVDGKGIFRCVNYRDALKYCMQLLQQDVERMKSIKEKTGRNVSKIVYIYNLEHMTLAKATHKKSIEYFLMGLTYFQDNFPEILKDVYIINASVYFTMVFSLVQRILAGSIIKKIHIFGTDGWVEELLKVVDADVLPAFLGGNRTDPDGNPYCHTMVEHAGMIPEKYYLKKNPENLLKQPGARVVTINAHADVQVPVYVKHPKSILRWKFESSKTDINFGLRYSEFQDSQSVDLIPVHKIETNLEPETGLYRCENAGNYIFIFDNSNSWFSSKQVYYLINVISKNDLS